jgi:uncharacterized protein (TIGR02271 family)
MASLRHVTSKDPEADGTIIGYTGLDAQGEDVGEVTGLVVTAGGDPCYLLLKTGGWFSHTEYAIPADAVTVYDDVQRRLTLRDATKDTLKEGRYPVYDDAWLAGQQAIDQQAPAQDGHDEQQHLVLRGEQVRVGARPETAATVRLRKRVVERQETVQVPLREEYLVVEHAAGDSVIRVDDRELRPGETVELQVLAERAVVSTETVVRETVRVHKVVAERLEQVQGTVRQEDLEVVEGGAFVDGQAALAPREASPAGNGSMEHRQEIA